MANAAATRIAATENRWFRRRREPASAVRVLVMVPLRGDGLMAFSLALLALRFGYKL
jgi:hypothetical protein